MWNLAGLTFIWLKRNLVHQNLQSIVTRPLEIRSLSFYFDHIVYSNIASSQTNALFDFQRWLKRNLLPGSFHYIKTQMFSMQNEWRKKTSVESGSLRVDIPTSRHNFCCLVNGQVFLGGCLTFFTLREWIIFPSPVSSKLLTIEMELLLSKKELTLKLLKRSMRGVLQQKREMSLH